MNVWAWVTGQAKRERRIKELEAEVRNLSRYKAADGDATVPYRAMLRQLKGMGEAEHWEDGNVERLERAAHDLLLHHGGAEVRPCEQQPAQSSSSGDGDRGTGSPTKAGEQGATAGDGERRKE